MNTFDKPPPHQDGQSIAVSPAPVSDSARPYVLIGMVTFVLLISGLGGWAAMIGLAGAVIAPGVVVVESNVKKVQHAVGGIVGEIFARDGDKVAAGDLVMRLDDTLARANYGIVSSVIDELTIRKARLFAERDGAPRIEVPRSLGSRADNDTNVRETIEGELVLFTSRRSARDGQRAQLSERISQLKQEIEGLTAQQEAKAREIQLIEKELVGLIELLEKELVPSLKVTSLQRERARLGGERGQLIAAVAQAKGKIAETELQIIQLDQDFKAEVARDIREVQAKIAEHSERRVAAEDTLKRIDIRSPYTGIVHQMTVHTVGGVITQSEPIMLIVPEGDPLVVEAQVAPLDIDQVRAGQVALVRFPAFSHYTTPEFVGVVDRVAADLTRDAQTGHSYYIARIALRDQTAKSASSMNLRPGMPAEVHIRTTERTAFSYLLKPISDQVARAFREP